MARPDRCKYGEECFKKPVLFSDIAPEKEDEPFEFQIEDEDISRQPEHLISDMIANDVMLFAIILRDKVHADA